MSGSGAGIGMEKVITKAVRKRIPLVLQMEAIVSCAAARGSMSAITSVPLTGTGIIPAFVTTSTVSASLFPADLDNWTPGLCKCKGLFYWKFSFLLLFSFLKRKKKTFIKR